MNFDQYFDENFFYLDRQNIFELNKIDNGPVNNVISHLNEKCYGAIIHDVNMPFKHSIFYIDNKIELGGIILDLSLEIDLVNRIKLTIEFCKQIYIRYPHCDVLDSFNTLQTQLRSQFEKAGFFTFGNDINEIPEDSIGILPKNKKGLLVIPTMKKLSLYRWIFDKNEESIDMNNDRIKKVYLILDPTNNLIKIGQSFYPNLREKTLQGINPTWDIITAWVAPISEEKRLHNIFKNKNIRGEWFDLNFNDLLDIKNEMKEFKKACNNS